MVLAAAVVLSLSTNALAFEYTSDSSGFKVNIPDKYQVIGAKDMVIAASTQAGYHGIVEVKANLSTAKFNSDIKSMNTAIKAGENILEIGEYSYLNGANKYDGFGKMRTLLGTANPEKLTYKVTKVNNIPALEVKKISKINYETLYPVPIGDKMRSAIEESNPNATISPDGKQVQFELELIENIYYVSQNDKLYKLFSFYMDPGKSKEIEKIVEPKSDLYKILKQAEFKINEFNKASKYFNKNVEFYPSKDNNKPLALPNDIFGTTYNIPNDWMYGFVIDKVSDTFMGVSEKESGGSADFNVVMALPYSTFEEALKIQTDTGGIVINTENKQLNVVTDLSKINIQKLLDSYTETFLAVSGKFIPKNKEQKGLFDSFLDNPAQSGIFLDYNIKNFFEKVILTKNNEVLKLENFKNKTYVNEYNGIINLNFDLIINLPENFMTGNFIDENFKKLSTEKVYNFKPTIESEIYFDRESRMNILLYGRSKKVPKRDLNTIINIK